jgi:hypothetical protein
VASKLGQDLDKVWATVCSSGGCSVKRLVDDPLLFHQSLQTVASKLGQDLDKVWATVCSSGGCAVKRLVDDPDHFMTALKIVANEIKMSEWGLFFLFTGCSDCLWSMIIDEAESVGEILSETSQDNYVLVKLNGTAEKNFWRNAEVRGAAQAHLAMDTSWSKIKAVLSNRGVDTAEKFDTAMSELTAEDTPQKYAPRTNKTMRRRSDQIEKLHQCDLCAKSYGTKQALHLHITRKHP